MTKPLTSAFLMEMIFKYNNPVGAVDVIKERYGEDKTGAYRKWRNVRAIIRSKNEYRAHDFHFRIGSIFEMGELPEFVETSCQEILATDCLHEQFKIFNNKRFQEWIKEKELDIKIMQDNYYLFEMGDPSYMYACKVSEANRVTERQCHRGNIQFEFDMIQLCRIRESISEYLDRITAINGIAECQRAVNALRFVTGRRPADIVFQSTFSPGANPYQAHVDKLSKQGYVHIVIPLLHRYEVVERVHNMIKKFVEKMNAQPPYSSLVTIPTYISKKMFGMKLGHTEIRSIYAELAFRERKSINHVHEDMEIPLEYYRRIFAHGSYEGSMNYALINIK